MRNEHYEGELQDLLDAAERARERFPGELREVVGALLALRGNAEGLEAAVPLLRMVSSALHSGDIARMRSALELWQGLPQDARNRIMQK